MSSAIRRRIRRACFLAVAAGFGISAAAAEVAPARHAAGALLQAALAGPLGQVDELVFATRPHYEDGHWYANIGYYCDNELHKAYAGNGKPDDGKLCALALRSGAVRVLVDAKGGSVRDPQVNYDGRKILFSYRKAGSDFYHLFETGVDGTGLKQLTSGEFDDIEPSYLPDGGIIFVSTRSRRWVNCWMTQVAVLYRCDAEGHGIHPVSANVEQDNTPWLMPDGRILYTRWEYVDRSQVEYHHLWTMNPDGTAQAVFFGNMHPRILMSDAKPIPGTDKVVATFGSWHGWKDHDGIATIVSAASGPDDLSVPRELHGGKFTRNPYPLSADCFLVARDKQIVLMDGGGREEVIYTYRGAGGVHEPRPVMPRPREPVLPPRSDPHQKTGCMLLADVYHGRNLPGVSRGDVRKLLVLEPLPKQVNFSGGQDLLSWDGTFTLERVLGSVPVEEDGSAYFEVPAGRQVFFVALDARDLSVKRMQSACSVMPGETVGCAGCHEARTETPRVQAAGPPRAVRRGPSRIEPFAGFPDVLDFTRDIQPILERRCVACHDYKKPEGKVILAGDLGPTWSHAYFNLFAHRQVADGRNGLGNQPPRSLGSSASAILKKVDGSHYDVTVTPHEWRTLWLWIESGAPYAGTYAALRNEHQQQSERAAIDAVFTAERPLLRRRCGHCHDDAPNATTGIAPLPVSGEFLAKSRSKYIEGKAGELVRWHWRKEVVEQSHGMIVGPLGRHERVVVENDPVARFSPSILLNFTRPELSPLVLGPLAKAAGGYGSCPGVFQDPSDPDYRQLLAAIRRGKALLDAEPRFGTAGFRPNRQYVREMKKYGILPASFDPAKDPIDVFESDQSYWKSFW